MQSPVCALLLVHGPDAYFRSAREAVASILSHTPFDVCVISDRRMDLPDNGNNRCTQQALPLHTGLQCRSTPFLRHFNGMQVGLAATSAEYCIVLDADAIVFRPFDLTDMLRDLGDAGLGLVEQTTITGSGMTRADFLDHYRRHALAWFDASPDDTPDVDGFHYLNAGVIVGRRETLGELIEWALDDMRQRDTAFEIGEHMISDQDYIQYWCHQLHPDRFTVLPWYWNHCEHWDGGFPRQDAIIAHFSNFCRGPTMAQIQRMRILRRQGSLDGLAGRAWTWLAHTGRV